MFAVGNSSESGSEVEWGRGEEEGEGGGGAESAGGWYVPPHLRDGGGGADYEVKAKQLERLRKKVQGLINR